MISLKSEEEIRKLIAEGSWSQREISQKTGISRGTISSIVNGTFRIRKATASDTIAEGGIVHPSGEYVRCPGCGGMVQMPCLACYFNKREQKYPDCVLESFRNPKPKSLTKCCISCGKTKPIGEFRTSGCISDGDVMCLSTCDACRHAEYQNKRNSILGSSKKDKRKGRMW
jgi:DNA-binding XRE family transcriptional regulator